MASVSIAILAGGRSRRLGADKALVRLTEGAPTLLERTVAVCAGLTDDLFVVAPLDRDYGGFGMRVVADRFPGEGPAGGVISALAGARHPCCLVVGCDYPFLPRPFLRRLIELADPDRPVTPQRPSMGRQGGNSTIEVLQTVYPVSALSALDAAFAAGERQLARMVLDLDPRFLPFEMLLRFDPGLLGFRSVNRPEDLAWARQELAWRCGREIARHAR